MLSRLKAWAEEIKRDVVALWLAARDRRTPWYAKLAAGALAAYALSPIDLIPDFIPVIGYADELVLLPVGIWLVIKLMPADLMTEFREEAARIARPKSYRGAAIIVALWIIAAALILWWFWPREAG